MADTVKNDPAAIAQDDELESRPYLPYEEDPAVSLDKPLETGGTPAAERIAALYERMGAVRAVLDGVIAFCVEPRTPADVEAEVERLLTGTFSVYSATVFPRLLVKAGALEEVGGVEAEPQVVEVDGVQYLEPAAAPSEQEEQPRLVATAAGLEVLAEHGSLSEFERVLEEDGRYVHIYRILLDCCSNEGGATAKQMGDAVDADPELQQPRMYASYFFERMSRCGLIAWTDAWRITDLGRQAAELLAERA